MKTFYFICLYISTILQDFYYAIHNNILLIQHNHYYYHGISYIKLSASSQNFNKKKKPQNGVNSSISADGVPLGNCDPFFCHPCDNSGGKGLKCRISSKSGNLVCCYCSNSGNHGPYSPPSSRKKYFRSACPITSSPPTIIVKNGQEKCLGCLNDMLHCGNKPPRSKVNGYYSHPCNLAPDCRPGFSSGQDLKPICAFCQNRSSHGPYKHESSESDDDDN
ncbi:unnamed protein product [Cryptosporidium hominis]|uniref:Uncharacterized protein n=2 Tax=Cryptosporidium hominis TaxID=237895 RepID=A0A0S4TIM9_CRYHO|nr:Uncharacterized protein GY17_00002882 [Cryptosporidium hominis]CUV06971.1 unnamed protein product [Cryptosporidium hominis]|eukprot:PPS94081.1 Uncharacterized protein GY17_00002882 [Cryptosporidium hominis]